MSDVDPATPSGPPAGFYDDPDGSGRQRWFDGSTWTDHYQSAPAVPQQPIQVTVAAPVGTDSRKARDKAVYTRQQKGHSLTLHILLIFVVVGMFTIPYYSLSPNHYWHA
jgi:hypothetical protein